MRITRVDSREITCVGTGRVVKQFNVPHYCREPTLTIIMSTKMRKKSLNAISFFLFMPNEQKPADEMRLGRISNWTNNIAILLCCAIFFSPSAAAVQSCLSAVGHYRLQARARLTRRARFTYYCAPTPPPPYLNTRVRALGAFAHSRPPTLVLARACRRGPRTRSVYAAFISRRRFFAAGVPDACHAGRARVRRRRRSSVSRPLPGWFPKIL